MRCNPACEATNGSEFVSLEHVASRAGAIPWPVLLLLAAVGRPGR